MSRFADRVRQFRSTEYPKRESLFQSLAGGQSPEALMICCSDSRVNPTLLTGSEPGDLFVLENAGNMVPAPEHGAGGGEAATVEYAVKALGVPEIIVCGHAKCGAMGGLMNPDALGELPEVAGWLKNGGSTREDVLARLPDASPEEQLAEAIRANVLLQIENLRLYPHVAEAERAGDLTLHGWVYDFVTGAVVRHDPQTGQWVEIL